MEIKDNQVNFISAYIRPICNHLFVQYIVINTLYVNYREPLNKVCRSTLSFRTTIDEVSIYEVLRQKQNFLIVSYPVVASSDQLAKL